jgi:hypothetical protein
LLLTTTVARCKDEERAVVLSPGMERAEAAATTETRRVSMGNIMAENREGRGRVGAGGGPSVPHQSRVSHL